MGTNWSCANAGDNLTRAKERPGSWDTNNLEPIRQKITNENEFPACVRSIYLCLLLLWGACTRDIVDLFMWPCIRVECMIEYGYLSIRRMWRGVAQNCDWLMEIERGDHTSFFHLLHMHCCVHVEWRWRWRWIWGQAPKPPSSLRSRIWESLCLSRSMRWAWE